jgi:hypothetical protein
MDAVDNPYTPGAGTRPVALAGREAVIVKVDVALRRIMAGHAEKSVLLVGLRGVGKTVLLNLLHDNALTHGMATVKIEAPEGRSLAGMLIPPLRAALINISARAQAQDAAQKAMRTLGSFVRAMKLKFNDIEFGIDLGAEEGSADTGDLAHDLDVLLRTVGTAARDSGTALVLCIDELQYVAESDLAALITALHACAQARLPVTLVGAGLPQLVGNMGRAKSYAERLFDYPEIGKLHPEDARDALTKPAQALGVAFSEPALEKLLQRTDCYPYFLQEWGKHTWNVAAASPIQADDVTRADTIVEVELDASFFRVRFDRCTPSEKQYLRAMADFDTPFVRSGDVAAKLNKQSNQTAPVRASLIKKGMVYSPSHGDVAYTVPLFGGYMRRMMLT